MRSIVTKYEQYSAFSGSPAECRHHLVYGRGVRNKAENDGLWIPLLNKEHNLSSRGNTYQIHNNPAAEKLSKMLGQTSWETQYLAERLAEIEGGDVFDYRDEAREAFRKRYGESFL